MAPWAYTSSPPVVWLSIRRAKLSYRTMPIHPSAHPNSPDHALRDLYRTVDDVVLADRVHAVDGQAVIAVDACREDHGRLERIALFARQAMIVVGCIHIEMSVQQVVDIHLLGCEL